MIESEIAENKVIPYLEKFLGWPKYLITQYGRVPVQVGTEVKWADIVAMFVDENNVAVPYFVVEVKPTLNNLNETLAQTDSYSKLLDAQYFMVTNGENYLFYQRRPTGAYIRINTIPIPDKKHLMATKDTRFKPGYILCEKPSTEGKKQISQYNELFTRIDNYFDMIAVGKHYLSKSGYSLRSDIAWHYSSIKCIHNLVHDKLNSLTPSEFRDAFNDHIMCERPANIKKIFSEVDNNFRKVKSFLRFVREFKGDAEKNLDILFDTSSELHIKGMGPFMISQFLAGAHPRDYTIIQDRMVNTMKNLDLIDTRVKSDTAKGYLYINDICKRLYSEIFNKKIEEHKSKFGFKIDQDFSLIIIHELFWEYDEFESYDISKLKEATGDKWQDLEQETERCLALIE